MQMKRFSAFFGVRLFNNKTVVGNEDVTVEMQFDPFDKGNYSPYYKRSSPTHTLHTKVVRRPTFITR